MLGPCSSPLALVSLRAAGRPALAPDTDMVALKNGDRLHGEIKALQFGRLEFKTTTMSTVYVEWEKVVELVPPDFDEVELTNGVRYQGSLEPASAGTLGVALEGRTTPLGLAPVARIRPLESSFWHRIGGGALSVSDYRPSDDDHAAAAVRAVRTVPGRAVRHGNTDPHHRITRHRHQAQADNRGQHEQTGSRSHVQASRQEIGYF
jgi:hypothetical protein